MAFLGSFEVLSVVAQESCSRLAIFGMQCGNPKGCGMKFVQIALLQGLEFAEASSLFFLFPFFKFLCQCFVDNLVNHTMLKVKDFSYFLN